MNIFKGNLLICCQIIFLLLSCNDEVTKPILKKDRFLKNSVKLSEVRFRANLDLMTKYKDKLYFVDWSKGSFNSFNLKNKRFETSFGTYGISPKEYLNVINFKVTDSSIVSYDSESSVYKNHSFKDSLYQYIKIPVSFNDAVFRDINKSILLMSRGSMENNFQLNFKVHDIVQSNTKNLDIDIEKIKKSFSGLAYNGFFVENENSKLIVYVPFMSDFYLVFDDTFNFLKKGEIIYKTPTPNYTLNKENAVVKDDYSQEVNINACIDNEFLYILNNVGDKFNYIDIYNLKSNKYYGSYRFQTSIDDSPREILIEKDKLFVLNNEKLEIFKI